MACSPDLQRCKSSESKSIPQLNQSVKSNDLRLIFVQLQLLEDWVMLCYASTYIVVVHGGNSYFVKVNARENSSLICASQTGLIETVLFIAH